jgi:acetyl esterase
MALTIDPQTKVFLDGANAAGPLFLRAETPEQARAKMQAMLEASPVPPQEIYRVEDRHIPGPAGQIPVRIYTPSARLPVGVLVYFHGGGWVLGDLQSHDNLCRAIANAAGCLVVSVDYRLAPEHKFPAAPNDCYAATKWVAANAAAFGGIPDKLAVGGDSAGGNLAAAVALMARDEGGPRIAFQLLIYPVTDSSLDFNSQREFEDDGFILSAADMKWFWDHYLERAADGKNPLASPLRAKNLEGLPPALVQTAGLDPLRDEGEEYASALKRAGNKVTLTRYEGVTHGFVSFFDMIDKGKEGIREGAEALRAAFAK